MKKLAVLVASTFALALGVSMHSSVAEAQAVQAAPALAQRADLPKPFIATTIKGTITVVPGQATGGLSGFKCSDLDIIATSKETKPMPPPPPGSFAFPVPKWTRTAQATGNFASGSCAYSMMVPGDQQFALNGSASGPYNCHVIGVTVGNTPTWQSVPKNSIKTDNISITQLECIIIH